MTQLPVKNTFIEVRTHDPIIVRPRAQTAEVVPSSSYLASSVEIAPAIAPTLAPAPVPVTGVPAVTVDSKVRAAPGSAACIVSSVDSTGRRCSVARTPDVLYARTPVGSIVAEPPFAFALPQAMDDHGRRRTSTFGTEAARVQTGHSSATRRSSLETIPATPDFHYSWPPPYAPPPVVMAGAVPEGSTQAAPTMPQLAHGMPILQCPPSQCQIQMPLQSAHPDSAYKQVAQTVSAQYPSLAHQFAHPPVPLGSSVPLPTQWDAPMQFIPQSLPPQIGQELPGKPLHKATGWQPQPGKFQPGPVPQQVLVLSNFLQEAPRKLEAQLPAETADIAQVQAPQGITTLMLRNIPVTFNRESLLADFDARGFRGKYDFFYLPIDFQTDNNLGYAFINLGTPIYAEQFRSTYQGLALAGDRSKKICAVAPATTQGRAANVEYYRNSNVMSMEDKYQPLVFENGVRAPFPSPTKAVKPIRYRESRGVVPE